MSEEIKKSNSLTVQCSGHITGCDFGNIDNVYCRYSFSLGFDWTVIGVRFNILTQIYLFSNRSLY